MIKGTVPVKTEDGQDELTTRSRRVSQRHRTVLLLVDGRRSEAQVRDLAAQAGAPAAFDELLALGLIALPNPALSPMPPGAESGVLHVDLPLDGFDGQVPAEDSLLPASAPLHPESVAAESVFGDPAASEAWLPSELAPGLGADPAFDEARLILLRAVRAEAPVVGSLTLLRLRRARTRADLLALLDEVEARISKPHRTLAASLTLRRVRQLLGIALDSTLAPA